MSSRTFTDQLGNTVIVSNPPQRIISLVPSQTELLAHLGLDSHVVGITKFCVHPPLWRSTKSIIGGTKNFNLEVIRSLNPDLIIGNKEENYVEGIQQLTQLCPVWMSDIKTMSDAFHMINQIGELTNKVDVSERLVQELTATISHIRKLPPLRTLYLIWQKPWMGAGTDTFIHELITQAGLQNCLTNHSRYPEISDEDFVQLNPELILLSSEPYPFQQKHIEEVQQRCPRAIIKLVDGEMFSWYGSRMLYFSTYINSLRESLQ